MTKIVIIGAGSGFGAELSCDILSLPELQNATIALCDTHEGRLAAITRYMRRVVEANNLPAQIVSSPDRRELLPDADFVVTSISVGGAAYHGHPFKAEVEIPQKYGVDQTVADTIGIGGVFRFLRTAPVQLAICRDMEELCPRALLLNYTNPMCMLTWLHSVGSTIKNVGLCHSIQHTASEISRYIGLPKGELSYTAAGINHQCWFLTLEHKGEDVYPRLWEALNTPEIFAKDNIRFEMMRYFGYFVSESSRHCSEYHPYFRRTPELMAQYDLHTARIADEPPTNRRLYLSDPENAPLRDLKVSVEYASQIVRAVVSDTPFRFWGNVMNTGLIDNLPRESCVEVPCMVDSQGVHPCHVGSLPAQLAHLNLTNIAPQELAVRAVLEKNRDYAFHAVALDPLARSVCSLPQLKEMFNELWEAEGDLLAYFSE